MITCAYDSKSQYALLLKFKVTYKDFPHTTKGFQRIDAVDLTTSINFSHPRKINLKFQ